ncbi:hypothetical protein [Sulfitobacter brevis]|uniref:hypothetical protein n=1 Tax=Sulfitobacter brevis TaxID=74348 RepID=UPI0015A6A48C|nr:hypothetical protein [Sulfitobacter brevis]
MNFFRENCARFLMLGGHQTGKPPTQHMLRGWHVSPLAVVVAGGLSYKVAGFSR